MGIGSQILMERRRRKIRQEPLAKKMGINMNTLTDLERERLPVGTEVLSLALKALDELSPDKTETTAVA